VDTHRRYLYLKAMGVQLWQRRTPGSGTAPTAGEAASVSAVATPTRQEALANPEVASMDWDALRASVARCRACALCETRTQTVFGVGHRHADLMLIGEAPGADEDRAGEPFVGRAGQLLNLMLQAIGLHREEVFIANILKCRPPGNRDPQPEEARQCEPYLLRQVALLAPRAILALGRVSAQSLLRTDAPLSRLRGRWHRFGDTGVPLYVTYHPAYLLRTPEQKAAAWRDLVEVLKRLRQAGDAAPRTEA